MGMLDFLQENWRDIYKPFQRYPEIYGEHAKQGMGMLKEDAPGAWDVATKPLGALMLSGIPSLYEAFRDEPIRNTLIDDLGIDPQKADYATQAIGLGMDVGVPAAVIRKGLTPWISEQVAKQANPTGFSPSRRRFLKGTGAAAAGTATGIPMLKQVAKTVPDIFGSTIANMSSALDAFNAVGSSTFGGEFTRSYGNLSSALASITNKTADDIKKATDYDKLAPPGFQSPRWSSIQGRSAEAAGRHGSDLPAVRKDASSINDKIKAQFEEDWGTSTKDKLDSHAQYREGHGDPLNLNIEPRLRDMSRERGVSGYYFNSARQAFDDIGWARSAYNHNPKKFLAAGQEKLSKLKSIRGDLKESIGQRQVPHEADIGYWIDYYDDLIPQLENFLKELSRQ